MSDGARFGVCFGPEGVEMYVLVTGGAGFLGSHLCEALIRRGDRVVCVDDLSTGRMRNIDHLLTSAAFEFQREDVSTHLENDGKVDVVAHLACPASPPEYLRRPLDTLAAASHGTENALRLAYKHGARFVLASTSEVYGDPAVHPQGEDYWGNTNPIGPRSVYDEGKRFAEALTMAYRRTLAVNTGIVRIFNTYGPRMRPDDGRVVSSFVAQALNNVPLTIYGDGTQTRSLCYVDDLVRGLIAMIDSAEAGPVNLGNPDELTVAELANLIIEITDSSSMTEFHPLPTDDPTRRCPQITRAFETLGWSPRVTTVTGLRRTVDWFRTIPEITASAMASLSGGQLDGAVPAPET